MKSLGFARLCRLAAPAAVAWSALWAVPTMAQTSGAKAPLPTSASGGVQVTGQTSSSASTAPGAGAQASGQSSAATQPTPGAASQARDAAQQAGARAQEGAASAARAAQSGARSAGEAAQGTARSARDAAAGAGRAAGRVAEDAGATARDSAQAAGSTAREAARGVRESAVGAGESAREAARRVGETARGAGTQVRESARATGEAARDAAGSVRDTAREAAGTVRDTARDAAGTVRDTARDTGRAARDSARDIGEAARDSAAGARDAARRAGQDAARNADAGLDADARLDAAARIEADTRMDADVQTEQQTLRGTVAGAADAQVQTQFNRADYRSADLGLWFNRVANGLVIADLAERTVFSRWGFQPGDRIVSVNGIPVTTERQFVDNVLIDDAERVRVVVARDGVEQVLFVEPRLLITAVTTVHHDPLEEFGIVLDDRYQNRVIVWRVLPRSPAYYAGIRPGDAIVTFEGRRVATPDDLVQAVAGIEAGVVVVGVHRLNQERFIEVELPHAIAVLPPAEEVREFRAFRGEVAPRTDAPVTPPGTLQVVPPAVPQAAPPAGPRIETQIAPPAVPQVVPPQSAVPAQEQPRRPGLLPRRR